jgi:phosphoglycolate phosphatase
MHTRAVLFDLDGTLVRTDINFAQMRAVIAQAYAEWKLPPPAPHADLLLSIADTCRDLQTLQSAEMAAQFRNHTYRLLEQIEQRDCACFTPIPAAADTVRRLADQGISVAVVTRNCRSVAQDLLHRAGIGTPVLVTRDEVTRVKPDPEHAAAAFHLLSVPPELRNHPFSWLVGDHGMDVLAAHNAGIGSIWVPPHTPHAPAASLQPHYRVDDITQAAELLLHRNG